jgi:hypothetical protein
VVAVLYTHLRPSLLIILLVLGSRKVELVVVCFVVLRSLGPVLDVNRLLEVKRGCFGKYVCWQARDLPVRV